mmetsp:Transcript_4535/g.7711  ORF Transcript_4535/g.7711 Transcript_4535/m.7711 type:complete len:253 (-) Transcript_4535:698-1456(-)
MAGCVLAQFQERVADVPSYLRRHLALIRDLDEKVQALQEEIEVHSKRKLSQPGPQSKRQKQKEDPAAYDMELAITRLISLADEKVGIAAQVYDFIDGHIQGLDVDLQALAREIEEEKPALGLGVDETACGALGIEMRRGNSLRRASKAGLAEAAAVQASVKSKQKQKTPGGGKKAGKDTTAELAAAVVAHAPSEHEPLYCYCQRPSHGNMVACDNDDCLHEWFHYECVGITDVKPNEVWFCPECKLAMGAAR